MENTAVESQLVCEKDAALQDCKLLIVIRIRQQPNQQPLSGNDDNLGNDRSARQGITHLAVSSRETAFVELYFLWGEEGQIEFQLSETWGKNK